MRNKHCWILNYLFLNILSLASNSTSSNTKKLQIINQIRRLNLNNVNVKLTSSLQGSNKIDSNNVELILNCDNLENCLSNKLQINQGSKKTLYKATLKYYESSVPINVVYIKLMRNHRFIHGDTLNVVLQDLDILKYLDNEYSIKVYGYCLTIGKYMNMKSLPRIYTVMFIKYVS